MPATENKFEGWGAFAPDSIKGNLKWFEYEPKPFVDDDVEIKILYCGICGSDLHTISSGWGDMSSAYPIVTGHEVVGEVVRLGKDVKHLKEGQVVGIGAQCDSCQDCFQCNKHREQYCDNGQTGTYASVFHRGPAAGAKSYGGYANYWRGPAHFAIPVPKNLDPAFAAPMLCAGTTLYSPLKQYGAGTTAKDVGIVGIGGLGHFGILFANKMGANVTAITHSHSKDADARKMGAKNILVSGDDARKAFKDHKRTLDLIICTSNQPDLPLEAYLSLLRPGGHFVLVGAAEVDSLPKVSPFTLILNNVHITGSAIGSPSIIKEVLEFAAEHDVKPWITKYSMKNANEAVVSMDKGEARYRYVLVNEDNGGKL